MSSDVVATALAVIGLVVAIIAALFAGIQAKRAAEALVVQQQISRGDAILHFTNRFFEIMNQGDQSYRFGDHEWARRFWSLLATEFYFFQHGMIPTFMYSLWMIRLASLYSGADSQEVRASHSKYLNTYSFNYPDMISFFSEIHLIAKSTDDEVLRNRKIADFVAKWISTNKKSTLM